MKDTYYPLGKETENKKMFPVVKMTEKYANDPIHIKVENFRREISNFFLRERKV